MQEEVNHLSHVHEAMQAAVLEANQKKPEMIAAHFKIDAEVKQQVDEICERHGVTLSAFVRHCCELLVMDYSGK